jgi:hypothetical protein
MVKPEADMNIWWVYLVLGLITGIAAGFFGIGGGTLLVPALVLLCGFSQHQAQGTTLSMLIVPVVFLAAWKYYSQGHVKISITALLCLGFFFGGLVGAHFACKIPDTLLRKIFGGYLGLIALKMILGK